MSIRYSDVKNGWPGEGSIDADPLFRNIENLNFHLMSVECGDSLDSPCIDAGDTASFDLILDCDWGLGTERSDMGAYGGYNEKVGINTTVETPDPPKGIFISQNFPNPFNPSTAILLNIPGGSEEKQKVNLIIYDLRGRVVKILIDNQLHAGSHKFIWDGKNEDGQKVSSGIYFCTLKSRDVTTTKKMVLIE
ncbi:MAG: FlgD immunoglobulin-like domain containing protein [Candidatus Glassbacteria bacterium]